MQERVEALGGAFAVEAGNGCGTCVRIVIPLSQSSGAAPPADVRWRPQ
jgi:signal transduction histidine kinase